MTMLDITFDLKPTDGRKSFYGKAVVRQLNGTATLYSYETPVIRRNRDGSFSRLWAGYSATTMRHVNAFMDHYGAPRGVSKSEWLALPVARDYAPLNAAAAYSGTLFPAA